MQTVTKCDKGEGVKNRDFYGDILFEWPLSCRNKLFFRMKNLLGIKTPESLLRKS